ncbi:L-aminoadipate-semialdehyde dehydrogenase [Fusarium austroafricanum]|uniref:L-aminoadipate-semialdehyde dehydrogenase n=1 Tax=Fusarium austroafricanum TaxID=2364996 RepID=A0A8H4KGQ3_9HYPO|nr:L-aminoadipate-semialdehyde dehydrogenase [Fusarium austroafricanum]
MAHVLTQDNNLFEYVDSWITQVIESQRGSSHDNMAPMPSPSKKRTISKVSKSPDHTPQRDLDHQAFELRPQFLQRYSDAHFVVVSSDDDESEEPTPRAPSVRQRTFGLSRPLQPPPQFLHNDPSVITTGSPQQRIRSSQNVTSGSPTKSEASSKTTTTTSKTSQRSAAKSTADLGVTTPAFTFDDTMVLPSDLGALKHARDNIGLIPAVIQDEIQAVITAIKSNEDIHPWNLDYTDQRSKQDALDELREIHLIYRQARYCAVNKAPEPNWNDSVTSRILVLALSDFKGVTPHNITAISSRKHLLPKGRNREPVEGRQIDYSINLSIEHDPEPESLANKLFLKMSQNHTSLNQCVHPLVRYRPAAVNIETKASTASDGRPQLAAWISAWMEQMRILKSWASCPEEREPILSPEPFELHMPLILAEKHT